MNNLEEQSDHALHMIVDSVKWKTETYKWIKTAAVILFLLIFVVENVILIRLSKEKEVPTGITVYVTDTGDKYHRYDCFYLRSKNAMPLERAARNHGQCSYCNPPTYHKKTYKPRFSEYSWVVWLEVATISVSTAAIFFLKKKQNLAEDRDCANRILEERRIKASNRFKFISKYGIARSLSDISGVPEEFRTENGPKEITVYITYGGKCYHMKGCKFAKYGIPVSLIKTYYRKYPCTFCSPPRPPVWMEKYRMVSIEAKQCDMDLLP